MVVLSCVRSSELRTIGFLSNKHRMCVAISRARELLVVVGSAHTLKTDKLWAKLHSVASPSTFNAHVLPQLVQQVSLHKIIIIYLVLLAGNNFRIEVIV
jgi:hypothetical protein